MFLRWSTNVPVLPIDHIRASCVPALRPVTLRLDQRCASHAITGGAQVSGNAREVTFSACAIAKLVLQDTAQLHVNMFVSPKVGCRAEKLEFCRLRRGN